jgi:hypothetical protein
MTDSRINVIRASARTPSHIDEVIKNSGRRACVRVLYCVRQINVDLKVNVDKLFF